MTVDVRAPLRRAEDLEGALACLEPIGAPHAASALRETLRALRAAGDSAGWGADDGRLADLLQAATLEAIACDASTDSAALRGRLRAADLDPRHVAGYARVLAGQPFGRDAARADRFELLALRLLCGSDGGAPPGLCPPEEASRILAELLPADQPAADPGIRARAARTFEAAARELDTFASCDAFFASASFPDLYGFKITLERDRADVGVLYAAIGYEAALARTASRLAPGEAARRAFEAGLSTAEAETRAVLGMARPSVTAATAAPRPTEPRLGAASGASLAPRPSTRTVRPARALPLPWPLLAGGAAAVALLSVGFVTQRPQMIHIAPVAARRSIGACDNSNDEQALAREYAGKGVPELARDCLVTECAPAGGPGVSKACVAGCLHGRTSGALSPTCGDCIGDVAKCVGEQCLDACRIDPGSSPCLACQCGRSPGRPNNCRDLYVRCSGIPDRTCASP